MSGCAAHAGTAFFASPPKTLHRRQGDEHPAEPLTVYCVRLSTSYARGAAHSEPYSSGVNLLLVGQDGRAVLQRIAPVNDPAESLQQINTICQARPHVRPMRPVHVHAWRWPTSFTGCRVPLHEWPDPMCGPCSLSAHPEPLSPSLFLPRLSTSPWG